MKNVLLVSALIFTLIFTCCKQQDIENIPIKTPTPKNSNNINNAATNISMDSIKGLSSEYAITLCQKVIGTKDDEHFMFQMAESHTGNHIGYRCDGAIEYDGKQYYVLRMLWSSVNDSVWSCIGFLGVSTNGNNICVLIEHSDGSYSVGKTLWEK